MESVKPCNFTLKFLHNGFSPLFSKCLGSNQCPLLYIPWCTFANMCIFGNWFFVYCWNSVGPEIRVILNCIFAKFEAFSPYFWNIHWVYFMIFTLFLYFRYFGIFSHSSKQLSSSKALPHYRCSNNTRPFIYCDLWPYGLWTLNENEMKKKIIHAGLIWRNTVFPIYFPSLLRVSFWLGFSYSKSFSWF